MRYASCLAVLACALMACDDNGTDIVVEDTPEYPVIRTWQANLTGLPARPQASGTVKNEENGSYMKATATVQGLIPDSTYHWRFYFGTCAARIGNYGQNASPPAYVPIKANTAGGGSSAATVMGRFRTDSTYHVRFFIPRTNPTDTVWTACGDLVRS